MKQHVRVVSQVGTETPKPRPQQPDPGTAQPEQLYPAPSAACPISPRYPAETHRRNSRARCQRRPPPEPAGRLGARLTVTT
jgi:hypothetical protein